MPELQHITQKVLDQVHEATGVPVIVQPDPSLTLLAKMTMARGSAPAHLISYNPRTASADYAICYQCGFILRVAGTPVEQRFEMAGTYRGRRDAEHLVNEQLRPLGLNRTQRLGVRDRMFDGLILQLRSVPLGLRVDAWLSQEHSGLADQQRAMISHQLQENTSALGPDVRKMTPAKILTASATMNAAFAAFWSRQWADSALVAPYRLSGHLAEGEELLKILDTTPDTPAQDRDLIDGWGRRLGLDGWYEFEMVRN